jgi:DNA-binding response OmpR family regulator/transcription antitermination factor NusG
MIAHAARHGGYDMRALLGHSDRLTRNLIASALSRAGFDVSVATNGMEVLQHWVDGKADLILLQMNLPDLNGLAVCHRIRREALTPIMMLADSASEEEVVRALDSGADDFVAEPRSAGELLARVRSVLRRARPGSESELTAQVPTGDLQLDPTTFRVTMQGRPITVTRLEFSILDLLAQNRGRVVPYSRLVAYAWGYMDEGASSLLKSHVYHLRKKLGLSADPEHGLSAVPGVGYQLAASVELTQAWAPGEDAPAGGSAEGQPGEDAPAGGSAEGQPGEDPPAGGSAEGEPGEPLPASDPVEPDLRWVVLKTQPWHESQAARAIAARGVEPYMPLVHAEPCGGPATPLFPGYLFARVNAAGDDLLRVRSAAGIAYVLPPGGPPVWVRDEVVEAIRARASSRDVPLRKGDRVTILRGPFRDIEALFDRWLDPAGRVRLLLELVERSAVLDIDHFNVRRLGG